MEQSHTNENQIMNYLLCLQNDRRAETHTDDMKRSFSGLFSQSDTESYPDRPDKSVISTIMHYAKALDALKTKDGDTFFLLGN